MGMGIILSAMSGAGNAVADSAAQAQKVSDEQALMQQRAALEEQKAKGIAQFTNDLASAPINRALGYMSGASSQQVPVTAAPVTALSGNDPTSAFNQSDDQNADGNGLDPSETPNLLARIQQLDDSNPDKAGMLAQLTRQQGSDQADAQSAVAGQTRAPTQQEILQRAQQDAMAAQDGEGYSALKSIAAGQVMKIGATDRLVGLDGRTILGADFGGEDRKDARQQTAIDAADERQQSRLDAQMKLEGMREDARTKALKAAADPWGVFSGTGPGADGTPQNLPHGDEFLKLLPPQAQEQVKALSEGRLSFPTGAAMRSPAAQNLIAAVAQYDPSFDAVNYGARSATRKDFTSGKASDSINAVNTVMQHLDNYMDAGAALNNSSIKPLNYLANGMLDASGDPRITQFNTTRNAVIDEVEKAYRGSGGSQAGIDAWKENMSSSQSPAQIQASGQQLVRLLEGKIEALGDQYSKGMGVTRSGLELLSPKAQAVYSKVTGSAPSAASAQASPTDNSDWSNLRVH